MARVRSTIERAATLHRQAVATIDMAAHTLDGFAPDRLPASLDCELRRLASQVNEVAALLAPGWLGREMDAGIADVPTGAAAGQVVPVRLGAGQLAADLSFPVVVPLLGAGSLAIESTDDVRTRQLIRSVLLRLVAATAPGSLRVRAIDPSATVFAEFAPLFDGRMMPPPVTDRAGLRVVLAEAEQWIRMPPQPNRHLLVVVAALPGRAEEADLARLRSIAEQGVAARVSVLIAGDISLPNAIRLRFDSETGETGEIRKVGVVSGATSGPFGAGSALTVPIRLDAAPTAELIGEVCAKVAARARAAGALVLRDLLPDEVWEADSAAGLTAVVGMAGLSPLALRLNDLTPHWLIGGRSDAGKSALLVNVLYGLCATYPPDELALYLLAFRDGVSLREFAPNDRDTTWIPHARAIGIEPDREYGLAVLRALEAEMAARAGLFEDAEVTRFAEYRTRAELPRVVCVIDEFQVLLAGDDRTARQAAVALETVARKGRAYGIHLILASQTLRGIEPSHAKRDSVFGQFPVRIALPGGGDVLDARNDSAAALPLGAAIINTAGGLGGPRGASRAHERLVEFPDPYAEPMVLSTLRRRLFLARPAGATPPSVFRGATRPRLPLKIPHGAHATAYLGHAIDAPLTPVTFPFDAMPGRHIAVIGPSEAGADLLDAAARSLAAQHTTGTVRFVIASQAITSDDVGTSLAADLSRYGHRVDVVDASRLRSMLAGEQLRDAYLIGFGLDGIGGADGGGAQMRWLLREGPSVGAHLIGWWRGLARFDEDIGGPAGRDDVAGVVLLNVPATDAALFIGAADLDWRPRPNRALMHDRRRARTEVIVPYIREGSR